MTPPPASPAKRLRRNPSDLRAEALAAARRLIVEGDGSALTMRAVADAIGVTYPNLSHHFGSAAGLHAAIAEELVRDLLDGLRALGTRMELFEGDPRRVVDQVFDLFERGGLGRVMGWIVAAGESPRLEAFHTLLAAFVADQAAKAGAPAPERITRLILIIGYAAYAETVVGPIYGQVMGLTAEDRRDALAGMLATLKASTNLREHQ
jgi:AcrR family transcriptional regulator